MGWLIYEIAIFAAMILCFFIKNETYNKMVYVIWLAFLIVDPLRILTGIRMFGVIVGLTFITGVFDDRGSHQKSGKG